MKSYKYYIIVIAMLAIFGAGIGMVHTTEVYAQTSENTAEKSLTKTEADKPYEQMIGLTAEIGFAEAAKEKTIEKLNEAGDIWQASVQLVGLTETEQFAEKIAKWYEENDLEGLALFSLNEDQRSDAPDELAGVFNPKMVMELSDEEKNLLQRLVEAEAGTEGVYGKIIVANVVLNRLNNGKMGGDTITEVIYAKIGGAVQFSPTVKKSFKTIKVTKETIEAVDRALSGEDYSQGAMWFYGWKRISEKKTKWFWNNTQFLFTYKNVTYFGKK